MGVTAVNGGYTQIEELILLLLGVGTAAAEHAEMIVKYELNESPRVAGELMVMIQFT